MTTPQAMAPPRYQPFSEINSINGGGRITHKRKQKQTVVTPGFRGVRSITAYGHKTQCKAHTTYPIDVTGLFLDVSDRFCRASQADEGGGSGYIQRKERPVSSSAARARRRRRHWEEAWEGVGPCSGCLEEGVQMGNTRDVRSRVAPLFPRQSRRVDRDGLERTKCTECFGQDAEGAAHGNVGSSRS